MLRDPYECPALNFSDKNSIRSVPLNTYKSIFLSLQKPSQALMGLMYCFMADSPIEDNIISVTADVNLFLVKADLIIFQQSTTSCSLNDGGVFCKATITDF